MQDFHYAVSIGLLPIITLHILDGFLKFKAKYMKKILIAHQSTIPHYRVPFFEAMERLRPDGWEFSVAFDKDEMAKKSFFQEPVDHTLFNFPLEDTSTYNFKIFKKSLTFQTFILRAWKYDVIIIGNTLHNISYLLAHFYHLFGKSIAVWWHRHNFPSTKLKGLRGMRENLMLRLAHMADGLFAYTPGGFKYLKEEGVKIEKIFVLNNTIDIMRQRKAFEQFAPQRDHLREKFALTGKKVLLFVGRLLKEKRLSFLMAAFSYLKEKDPSYHMVIVGGGDTSFLHNVREKWGEDSVTYHGILVETEDLAALYVVSDLYVNTGDVGLGIIQSLCFDLTPAVIDSTTHNPEFGYLNSKNSLMLREGATFTEYADAIDNLLNDRFRLAYLRSRAWTSIEHLTIENMAKNFINGVEFILKSKS